MKKALKDFIVLRAVEEERSVRGEGGRSPQGAPLGGAELVKIQEAINDIPDKETRTRLEGWFQVFTKYQVLGMLINERSGIIAKFPEQVGRIAEAATEIEFLKHNSIPELLR